MKAYLVKETTTNQYYISGQLGLTQDLGKTFQTLTAALKRKEKCEDMARYLRKPDYNFIVVSYDLDPEYEITEG